MSEIILTADVQHDEYTAAVERLFGLPLEKTSTVVVKDNIDFPETEWHVGFIYGASGSGKSTLLKKYGKIVENAWNDKPIISNFTNTPPEHAATLLTSMGFSSVPAWLRPFHSLSVGEQFRANLARTLSHDRFLYAIDEFTSNLDRNVARATAHSVAKYLRRTGKKCIFASCHADILEYLRPDWHYNPAEGVTRTGSDSLQRPPISLEIIRCKQSAWQLFRQHHFLDTTLNQGARCFLALWDGVPVAFSAALALPHPTIGYAWRESRTVVLPDYQGLNIGVKLSDFIASMARATGCRFYSKTVHPAMVSYRQRSANWKETAGSGKLKLTGNKSMIEKGWTPTARRCYSFEYIGPASSDEDAKLFWDDAEYAQRKKKKKISLGLIHKGQTLK